MKNRLAILIFVVLLVVVPVYSQDDLDHTLTFDGVTFTYPSDLATNVNLFQVQGIEPSSEYGFSHPPFTSFVLYHPSADLVNLAPLPESPFDAEAGIYVYRTSDFVGYDEYTERFEALRTLLNDRPELSFYQAVDVSLPYLPIYLGAQTFRSYVHYIDTPQLQGIGYITAYQEVAEPFLNNSLFYTIQAITTDETSYVTIIVPLQVSLLPETTDASFNYEAFVNNFQTYLMDTMTEVNNASSDSFSPRLEQIDELALSLNFPSS